MRYRSKLSRGRSKKMFRRGASLSHRKNFAGTPSMRGGIRL